MDANGKLRASEALSQAAGPSLAGGLAQLVGAPLVLILDALSYLASARLLGSVRAAEPARAQAEGADAARRGVLAAVERTAAELTEGLRFTLGNPVLRALLASSVTFNVFGGFFAALFVIFATRELGLSPAAVGAVLAVQGVGGVLGALFVGRVVGRLGQGPVLVLAGAGQGVGWLALPAAGAFGLPAAPTLSLDLERRKVVDLLPECSQDSLASWLGRHPGVEVATRDRSRVYREALAKGAPSAVQVADRWHLLHGLTLALEEFLLRKRPALRNAASEHETAEPEEDARAPDPMRSARPGSWRARKEEAARQRHERLVQQWEDIRRLHLAGADARFIARKLGIGARTVYRYKELVEPPPRQTHTTRASVLDPYVPYLLGRWEEGCRDGKRLLREIREQGYANSERTFIRFTAELRRTEADGNPPSSTPRAKKGSVAGLFMRREEKLSEEQKEYLGRLCASDVALRDARRLTQEFAGMVRNREGEKLDGWLAEAEASEAEVMGKFAAGLKKDHSAVRAGLTESWSNGPVEGFVHKLKLVKRQGYGRAGFDLLRARVLAA